MEFRPLMVGKPAASPRRRTHKPQEGAKAAHPLGMGGLFGTGSWDFRLWALGFRLWALGLGLWALGFGLWALGLGVDPQLTFLSSTQTFRIIAHSSLLRGREAGEVLSRSARLSLEEAPLAGFGGTVGMTSEIKWTKLSRPHIAVSLYTVRPGTRVSQHSVNWPRTRIGGRAGSRVRA